MDADQRHRPDLVFSESETGNAPGTACHAKSSVRRGYPNGVVHTSPRATPWGRRDNPSSPVRASHQRGLQGLMSRPFRAYTVMPMGPRALALGWYVPPFQGFQDPTSPWRHIGRRCQRNVFVDANQMFDSGIRPVNLHYLPTSQIVCGLP